MASRAVKKVYDNKLCALLEKYSKILIVGADNVDTKQLQDIRRALHDKAVVSMGKNPMMRRSLRIYAERTGNKAFLGLIPFIKGNVGLIFTNGDLQEVGAEIGKHKVGEPARVSLVSSIGLVPPIDIVSQPGSTGMDPSHSSIFEDPTKIAVAMAPDAAADPGAAPDVAAKGRMSLGG